jgi:hypothetical protein
MQEVWLRPNRRVFIVSMILPAIFVAGGITLAALAWNSSLHGVFGVLGLLAAAAGLFLIAIAVVFLRTPRLAYFAGDLLINLRFGSPYRVPIQFVECVFLGKAAARASRKSLVPVQSLIIRLAEKASDYHHREVKKSLGSWADGYITIHGAWCEPLTVEFVHRLNSRLAEIHQMQTAQA